MPYDDSNIKRMVKEQLAKKVGFSKNKKLSAECKDLIHKIMEVNVKKRLPVAAMLDHPWLAQGNPGTDPAEEPRRERVDPNLAPLSSIMNPSGKLAWKLKTNLYILKLGVEKGTIFNRT
jgi:serine/threonine protein kinase